MNDKKDYVEERLLNCQRFHVSKHAMERANLRGLSIERIYDVLENTNIIGVKPNKNPNTDIVYQEAYKILVKSEKDEFFILPIYFQKDRALITTVLKLSNDNSKVLEW